MAKITLRFNEDGSIAVALKDTDANGKRIVRVAVATNVADLGRAVGTLFESPTP